MMDRKELLKKLFLAPVDTLTLLPFVTGTTLGLGAWAVDARSGLWWFSSAFLTLASLLIYIQRLALGWNKYQVKILEDAQEKESKQREAKLDDLFKRLKKDHDTRTDELLDDLRLVTGNLARNINESSGWVRTMALDIKVVVDELFNACVQYLEKSLELYQTAQSVRDGRIKQNNLDERERLIKEVRTSLQQLGDILANVRAINLKRATNSQAGAADSNGLEQLRRELGLKLQAAKDVEETVNPGAFAGIDVRKYINKGRETAAVEEGGQHGSGK